MKLKILHMKNGTTHFAKLLSIIAILAFAVLIVVAVCSSIKYDISCNNNFVTMLSGLWSAFATVVLGFIAIWQNRQYKKLSDKTSIETTALQHEIKELTEKSQQALSTLKKIENSRYQPMLEIWNINIFGFAKESYKEYTRKYNCVPQANYFNGHPDIYSKNIGETLSQYNSFGFLIKNIGEKTIRSLSAAYEMDQSNYYSFTAFSCDIDPGAFAFVLLINIENFENNEQEIQLQFNMQNLIGESYSFPLNLHFYYDEYEKTPGVVYNGGDMNVVIIPDLR